MEENKLDKWWNGLTAKEKDMIFDLVDNTCSKCEVCGKYINEGYTNDNGICVCSDECLDTYFDCNQDAMQNCLDSGYIYWNTMLI